MKRQPRKLPLEEKLCLAAITIFCFGLCLMLNFGEMPFLVCLAFSLSLCIAGLLYSHKRENNARQNRYLP